MTETLRATVTSSNASRYLQQLAKHWSHKFAVEFDPNHARIPFDNGAVARIEATDDMLTVVIEAPDAALRERMAKVVAEHLDRFAFREAPLPFEWR